jgi:hypothetical protein
MEPASVFTLDYLSRKKKMRDGARSMGIVIFFGGKEGELRKVEKMRFWEVLGLFHEYFAGDLQV